MNASSMMVATDAIAVAAQMGRLDFISAVLASLSVLIVVASFPLFFFLRGRAEKVAREAADEYLKAATSTVEREAAKRLEEMLPKMVQDYVELARNNAVSPEQADEIAAAQEEGE